MPFSRTASMAALALAASLASHPAWSGPASASASIKVIKASNNLPYAITDLSSSDGVTAGVQVVQDHFRIGGVYQPLRPDQDLEEVPFELDWSYSGVSPVLHTASDNGIQLGSSSATLDRAQVFLPDGEDAGSVVYQGSLMTVRLTPHTSATLVTTTQIDLKVAAPLAYRNTGHEEMPSVKAMAYTYFGLVKDSALQTYGAGNGLIDPDADGYICPGCEDDSDRYWHRLELVPDPATATLADLGGENTLSQYHEQFVTLTNDTDTEKVFRLMTYSHAIAMNVVQSPVPEADVGLMMGLGLLGMGWAARRRAKMA